MYHLSLQMAQSQMQPIKRGLFSSPNFPNLLLRSILKLSQPNILA